MSTFKGEQSRLPRTTAPGSKAWKSPGLDRPSIAVASRIPIIAQQANLVRIQESPCISTSSSPATLSDCAGCYRRPGSFVGAEYLTSLDSSKSAGRKSLGEACLESASPKALYLQHRCDSEAFGKSTGRLTPSSARVKPSKLPRRSLSQIVLAKPTKGHADSDQEIKSRPTDELIRILRKAQDANDRCADGGLDVDEKRCIAQALASLEGVPLNTGDGTELQQIQRVISDIKKTVKRKSQHEVTKSHISAGKDAKPVVRAQTNSRPSEHQNPFSISQKRGSVGIPSTAQKHLVDQKPSLPVKETSNLSSPHSSIYESSARRTSIGFPSVASPEASRDSKITTSKCRMTSGILPMSALTRKYSRDRLLTTRRSQGGKRSEVSPHRHIRRTREETCARQPDRISAPCQNAQQSKIYCPRSKSLVLLSKLGGMFASRKCAKNACAENASSDVPVPNSKQRSMRREREKRSADRTSPIGSCQTRPSNDAIRDKRHRDKLRHEAVNLVEKARGEDRFTERLRLLQMAKFAGDAVEAMCKTEIAREKAAQAAREAAMHHERISNVLAMLKENLLTLM